MKKKLLNTIIFGLVLLLILNIASPAYANQTVNTLPVNSSNLTDSEEKTITNHLENLETVVANNTGELSEENKEIARESLVNIDENLIYADITNGEKSIILDTDKEDTFVAITDETIDVVERVGEHDFLINGEKHHFELTVSDEPEYEQQSFASETNNRTSLEGMSTVSATSTWTLSTVKWVNVNAQRNFSTYAASTLGGIIGALLGSAFGLGFGGGIGASAGVAIAYNYAASAAYPTNVGKSQVYIYKQGRSPLTDYKLVSKDYAVYKGKNVYLGQTTKIKKSCVGCGV